MTPEQLGQLLRNLLFVAWVLPLVGFCIEVLGGYWSDRRSKAAAHLAVGCIGIGFLCSLSALCIWGKETKWSALEVEEHHASDHGDDHDDGHHDEDGGHEDEEHAAHDDDEHHEDGEESHSDTPHVYLGKFYTLAKFGRLELAIDYYIDSLTLVMFTMVTFIATCIHIFAIGYMSDELTEEHEDHEVHTSSGGHFVRPGRFYKFFSYLSLFCFSMLGLVIAGNIFQVFVFWELVGICSYLLIGFYVERKSANVAANKAFIMNRVGDFGFLIGLMIILTSFGTFQFGDETVATDDGDVTRPGLFKMLRGTDGELKTDDEKNPTVAYIHTADGEVLKDAESGEPTGIPYTLLVIAGLGIFAGCVGKSAQFPLQTWLPDAMEGPTPVSALVHSATMVAAGVYLAARFFPMFAPEVLLTIAYVGCITLFVAATIAVVATDIKRVLAYSTISQLGYMMLAIGLGGWLAGLFHLVTHAFFKSLMFLASGSVIVGCHHEQEMPKMGGLRKKMPITATAMLVGVIAISGLAIPGTMVAFSGFHSKDAIMAAGRAYTILNPAHFLLFAVPLITAGITAFYMFRLWFYTFAGKPRDQHLHDHAKESPWVMTVPLILLSLLAAGCTLGYVNGGIVSGEKGALYQLLDDSEPVGLDHGYAAAGTVPIAIPSHDDHHKVHSEAGMLALIAAGTGTLLAFLLYGTTLINPAEIKKNLAGVHTFLVEKWRFDELYDVMFVRPVHIVATWFAAFDRVVLDGILHAVCRFGVAFSAVNRKFDEVAVDGLVNWFGTASQKTGQSFRVIQTGRLRQYVMFIAVGVVGLFVLLLTFFPKA